MLGGAGIGLSFVPMTIASLTGVDRADAGVASGLINTSRQIGGAIGIAAVSAIAATSTAQLPRRHAGIATSGAALDHGLQTALYVVAGLAVAATVITAVFLRTAATPSVQVARVEERAAAIEEAA